ncbi:hypothetical protein V8F06_005946 [Rhypophila decipiens]
MTTALFPSWEFLKADRQPPDVPLDSLRIRWKAFDSPTDRDLASAIRVAANARDPPSENDEPFSSLHPISSMLLTDPPISSITVRLDDLETHEENWVHDHIPHWDTAVWEDVDGPEQGDIDPDDEELDDVNADPPGQDLRQQGKRRRLVRCCNRDRPAPPAPLTIHATDNAKGVTIHDYVVAVDAYLQSHRREILRARRSAGWTENKAALYVDLMSIDKILLADGEAGRDSGFMSMWWRWASYVDRREGGQFPSREELLRSAQPMGPTYSAEFVAAHPDTPAVHYSLSSADILAELVRQNKRAPGYGE